VRAVRTALHTIPLLAAIACGGSSEPAPEPTPTPCPPATSAYATAVIESWIPACSRTQDSYNDPTRALGPPDAAGSRAAGYTGFVSLGFGGHVTIDFGGCVADQPGADVRVFQAVSSEPVTVYVSTSPDGPFTLVPPFFQDCGNRYQGIQGYCLFDLASAGIASMRYVRVEDAEIYPCPGGTDSEGADLDSVQALHVSAGALPAPLAAAPLDATSSSGAARSPGREASRTLPD
jgi:hypothetical protein